MLWYHKLHTLLLYYAMEDFFSWSFLGKISTELGSFIQIIGQCKCFWAGKLFEQVTYINFFYSLIHTSIIAIDTEPGVHIRNSFVISYVRRKITLKTITFLVYSDIIERKLINALSTFFIYNMVLDLFGMNKTIQCVKNNSLLLKKE